MPTTAIQRFVPGPERDTRQQLFVAAAPADTYDAIWAADLMRTPLARALSAVAMWPTRVLAWLRREPQPPGGSHSAGLRDMLADTSPWTLLADEPGSGVVLGLLWTPPAGGTKRAPEEFAAFSEPGFAKVAWSLSVAPFGAGHAVLTTETRTVTTDAGASGRLRLLWPFFAPFAALLRMQVLRAIKDEAERAPAAGAYTASAARVTTSS